MPSTRPRRKVVKSPTPDEDEDMLSESGSDNLEVEDEMPEDVDQEDQDLEADEEPIQDEENADSGDEDDELLSQEEDEDDDEEDEEDEEEEDDDDQEDDGEQEVITPRKDTKRTASSKRKRQAAVLSSDEEMSETEVVPNRPLTKRQRAKLNDGAEEDYLELPMDSGKKKHLTVEEQALRRSEVARRRKNQSIQRAEKDKADTINRLLKKQASKSKKAIKDDGGDGTDSAIGENGRPQPRIPEVPTQIRYVSNKAGSSLSIPSTMDLNDLIASSKYVTV
ncbi:hypothetical protein INT44_006631 [Umbelopsis vinacea]|uniref:INO80 complex subunit B-like conserved region domain-containing protein n=1 Tax=Umbelopsis vinacea TaxID=44442 RepID=A0A8H7PEI4_9FUNG|nr:hypothetical protein INT44_006631 [Umbelopsis vinacea]